MDKIRISTTQNVTIDYTIASIGDRILAALLDYLLFLVYFIIIGYIISEIGGLENNTYLSMLLFLPVFFYDLYCELFFNGQSFGKYILKIKVVKIDGSQPNLGSYLLRWIFRLIEGVIFFWGLVGLFTILINGKGQRLGDIAAKTAVIKIGNKIALQDTIYKKVATDYNVVFREAENLSEKDITIISEIFNYALKEGKFDVINQLADKTKTTLNIKTDLKSIAFLETIIKDFTHLYFNE